jgi:hypothetical protein
MPFGGTDSNRVARKAAGAFDASGTLIAVKTLHAQYAARSAAVAAPVSAGVDVVGDDFGNHMIMRHPPYSDIKAVGYFESGVPVSHR